MAPMRRREPCGDTDPQGHRLMFRSATPTDQVVKSHLKLRTLCLTDQVQTWSPALLDNQTKAIHLVVLLVPRLLHTF